MSSKINLQTCEYACKSSIFQDNQLIYNKNMEKYQTALKEEYWGDISQFEHLECKVWSPPDTYLEAQTLLTDKLIKI